MDKKPLLPTNDYVFKKIFSENMFALADFLQKTLELPAEEYKRLEVIDPNLLPANIENKHCILDIKLYTQSGTVIDIEIQIKYQKSIWKRVQYYNAMMLTEQSKARGKYQDIPQAITILITDFVLVKEDDIYHHCFRLYDKKAKVSFPDSLEIDVLEIPKVHKGDQTDLGNWMRFFAAKEEEEFEMIAQTNPAIAEAWGVIKHLSADESARMIAESREKARMDIESWVSDALEEGEQKGRQEGLQEGLQEGERKGWQEGVYSVAKNLLQEKMPAEAVVRVTGLSLEEVKRLALAVGESCDPKGL